MDRVYNFAAGPAAMPLPVLERAAREMTCYASKGMSTPQPIRVLRIEGGVENCG